MVAFIVPPAYDVYDPLSRMYTHTNTYGWRCLAPHAMNGNDRTNDKTEGSQPDVEFFRFELEHCCGSIWLSQPRPVGVKSDGAGG